MRFIKMEGTGNDYVYFENFDKRFSPDRDEIIHISDRRFGVGGDGVVLVQPSTRAEARMEMYNADGSSSAMCGNALRCVGYLVYRRTGKKEFLLETDVGIHRTQILDSSLNQATVCIEIGEPAFGDERIPFDATQKNVRKLTDSEREITLPDGRKVKGFLVNMGNPHFVVKVDDPDTYPVESTGPLLENHPAFPERTNVEFVSITDGKLIQRTWERGSGETLSCGSGACATLVAFSSRSLVSRESKIHLRGGDLMVRWREDQMIELTGPATLVFEGEWPEKK